MPQAGYGTDSPPTADAAVAVATPTTGWAADLRHELSSTWGDIVRRGASEGESEAEAGRGEEEWQLLQFEFLLPGHR